MKKLITILFAILTVTMLTSCFFVRKDDDTVEIGIIDTKYDITCYNDTYRTVTDWCVKRNGKTTYANDDHNCEIGAGASETIYDLPMGDYKLYFTFVNRYRLHDDDYESTGNFFLNEDVIFYVSERRVHSRSITDSDESEEPEYVIICSDGKEYPLVKVEQ